MVTLISQSPTSSKRTCAPSRPSDPSIELLGPSASAVILASEESEHFAYDGIARRLRWARRATPSPAHFRQAGTLRDRRWRSRWHGREQADAIERAKAAAARLKIRYEP